MWGCVVGGCGIHRQLSRCTATLVLRATTGGRGGARGGPHAAGCRCSIQPGGSAEAVSAHANAVLPITGALKPARLAGQRGSPADGSW
jgi:hypothetical protein